MRENTTLREESALGLNNVFWGGGGGAGSPFGSLGANLGPLKIVV
jgi:hypothetical protein